jgi:dihydroflavonol-4-reductase
MPKVAVTGATGFIGSAVVRKLVERGRDVRALVEPGAPTANLAGARVERVTCDVTDRASVKAGLAGCDTLYHLAAIYKIWTPRPDVLYRVNVEGTATVMLAASEANVRRVVHTSSIAAVGLVEGGLANEDTAFNLFDIATPYILSKWMSERVALRFAEAGLPVVVVNPAFPFGPGDIGPTPTGRIVQTLLAGEVPGYAAGGFCAIDVDDCAEAHLAAEEKGRAGERYILGNHNVTFKQFFDVVCAVAGLPKVRVPIPGALATGLARGMEAWADRVSHKEPPATLRAAQYALKKSFFDNTKARRELGLPTRPLEETARRAVEYFRATARG